MARKFPDAVYAYIKARALAGIDGATIAAELQSGTVEDLGAVDISKRTVQGLAADVKREHAQSGEDLEPASEDAIQSELRLLLAEAKRRRKYASNLPMDDPKATRFLSDVTRLLADIRRHMPSDKDPTKQAHGAAPDKTSTLDRLAETVREPASDTPTTTEALTSQHSGDPISQAKESTQPYALA